MNFFYKNITFGVTLFLYDAYTSFSGQPLYNDWAMASYNVFFTSLPVVAMGVFDQDVSARFCLKVPLYGTTYDPSYRHQLTLPDSIVILTDCD